MTNVGKRHFERSRTFEYSLILYTYLAFLLVISIAWDSHAGS